MPSEVPQRPDEMTQWCDRHWQPFREGSEDGTVNGLAGTIFLMQALLMVQEFADLCGRDAKPERMNQVMVDISPICCWMGDKAMAVVLAWAMGPSAKGQERQQIT